MDNAIGDNINAIRVDLGLSQKQLAEVAGVSQTTVSAWECGIVQPRKTNIEALAAALDLSYDQIVSRDHGYASLALDRHRRTPAVLQPERCEDCRADAAATAPVCGSIAAGTPSAMYVTDERFFIPPVLKDRHPRAFFLRVKGNSMNRTLPPGCLALIDPDQRRPDPRGAFAVRVGGGDAAIKRIRVVKDGIVLVPDSTDPSIGEIAYDANSHESDEIVVIGRVVWMAAPLDYRI